MIKKILYAILIFIVCINVFSFNAVYAVPNQQTQQTDSGGGSKKDDTTIKSSSGDGIISGANGLVKQGEKQVEEEDAINQDKLVEISNSIYNILLAIAMVVAVAVGIVLGIKFMTSSVEEQAKVKEMLVPYVAGCIVVFGAMGIWKLAVTTFAKF